MGTCVGGNNLPLAPRLGHRPASSLVNSCSVRSSFRRITLSTAPASTG